MFPIRGTSTPADDNGEIEALGVVPVGPDKGALLAISERQWDDEGHASAWLWRGKRAKRFAIARLGDFEVTDLTILADGTVLTLERSFSATALPGMAIRRFPIAEVAEGKVITPELLFEGTRALLRHRQHGGHRCLPARRRNPHHASCRTTTSTRGCSAA